VIEPREKAIQAEGPMAIAPEAITGLVLAGGQGRRMGGVDKGLQPCGGEPLVAHALRRLRPQVGALAVNANRNLVDYARFGLPVWPDAAREDAAAAFRGPLAGLLAGLTACTTPWLVAVPCDSPRLPLDLVERLAQAAIAAGCDAAVACTEEAGTWHRQPVFCLLQRRLRGPLADFLARGEQKVGFWLREQGAVEVRFADAGAFRNVNTLADLAALAQGPAPGSGRRLSCD
jgi:molybdopterin-guanine dinucleotide biosynthesis protein A